MRLFSGRLDEREEAILDPTKVGYFGSWLLNGSDELEESCETSRWWTGDELAGETPASMGGDELDRRAAGY